MLNIICRLRGCQVFRLIFMKFRHRDGSGKVRYVKDRVIKYVRVEEEVVAERA